MSVKSYHFLPRRLVRQRAIQPLVVIVVLSLPELFIEGWSGEINCRVKLVPVGFLTPFYSPIEMMRPRLDQAKLGRVAHQPLLEFVCEELHHTVGMDALDREGRRFNHVAKEIERVRKIVRIAVLLTLSLQSYEAERALTSAPRGRANKKS